MKIRIKHLEEVGESYFQHMKTALEISFRLLFSSLFQLLHALFPFVHPPFGTDLKGITAELIKRTIKIEKTKKEKGL